MNYTNMTKKQAIEYSRLSTWWITQLATALASPTCTKEYATQITRNAVVDLNNKVEKFITCKKAKKSKN